jgi:glycosyltransferase involved in cell wall biosynthesis
MDLVPPKYKQMLLLTHRMAHGIVANCEEMKRHLTADYHYPADRIQVCYNGIDTARFSPQPRPGGELLVGTVGVLRPEKNLGLLLDAFARVQSLRPGMKLLVVGSGPERERLEARSAALGISSHCTFEPSTADVPNFMRSIDIFVHPSLSEGLPNAVMEAMACGCAVIASRVGGCAELIEHGRTGLLVPPGDLDALTACLASAIGNDSARHAMAAAAAEEMQKFSLARAAARMQSIYANYLRLE